MELDVQSICCIAREAGNAILEIYDEANYLIQKKDDDSPLTEADLAAHHIICDQLLRYTPEIPILSEESLPELQCDRHKWQNFWLIDPLDGTKEFIARTGDFTVNIALISEGQPILGVVYAPVTRTCYYAQAGMGAFQQIDNQTPIHIEVRTNQEELIVLGSRRHGRERLERFLARLPKPYIRKHIGSSLKFCLLAAGEADLYPRLGPTSEWDTAAAHCILKEAGGEVMDLNGYPLTYNKNESIRNPEFIAVADRHVNWLSYLESST